MTVQCRANDLSNTTLITISDKTKLIDISTNVQFFSFLNTYNKQLFYLSILNMSSCGISSIQTDFFRSMRNLLILDLSNNDLTVMKSSIFINQQRLVGLFLDGNSRIHAIEPDSIQGLHSLKHFKLTHARIGHIASGAFASQGMETFDLSNNVIGVIDNQVFDGLSVVDLYLNGSVIHSFDFGMFTGLNISSTLFTEAYKFCCIRPTLLPEEKCYPHRDEFSSCEDLMRNSALRALLWVIGIFSLLGNVASLVYRFLYDRRRLRIGYGIFVTNLAIADFLMGLYLIIIAIADVAFRGTYIYKEEVWRGSAWCKLAGVFSTMSSEASVLFICLITIDRLFVIKYPFGQVRFSTRLATILSCIVWSVVGIVALLPIIITSYFEGAFYSKSGVCLALPLTRDRPTGWIYSVSIFIGFNFITFLAIAFGQWVIYTTINSAKQKVKACTSGRRNDLRVARNLLLVASTDFLCWFPIGILGKSLFNMHLATLDVTRYLLFTLNSRTEVCKSQC